jgi:HAD superfamily hydrolase (TIGR01509 family)
MGLCRCLYLYHHISVSRCETKQMGLAPVPVFDIGGVLVQWEPRLLYRQLIPNAEEMEHFIAHVCPGDWNFELDGRRPFAAGLAERMVMFPEKADLIHAFDERWIETVSGPIETTVRILREIRDRGFPTYAITNFSDVKFDVLAEQFSFLKDFDGLIVSARERLIKPDPGIYKLLCDRYGLVAEDCIFIDDTLANVEGARSVGMKGHHFRNSEDLRIALAGFGLVA